MTTHKNRARRVVAASTIALAMIVVFTALHTWLWAPHKTTEVVDAIHAYSENWFTNWSGSAPGGPTIVAVRLSESDWMVRFTRGVPGPTREVKYARYNFRTCAVTPYPSSYVPPTGPFSATARAAVIPPWHRPIERLTADEMAARAINLKGLFSTGEIGEDIEWFNDDGVGMWPSQVLYPYALRVGWVQAAETASIIVIGLDDCESAHSWTFYLDSGGPGGPPCASFNDGMPMGQIDFWTLKITFWTRG